MATQPLEDLAARLERERTDADRRYNEALTALDGAIGSRARVPAVPLPVDGTSASALNASWNILPDGAPATDRSLKGRLRGFIWRLIGPPLETQKRFNALAVDAINQQTTKSLETTAALGAIAAALAQELDALATVESRLVQYLQTITEYVDSKDRAALGGNLRERVGMAEQRISALKREIETRPGPQPPASSTQVFSRPVDSIAYVGFEDRFRGPQREISARVADYLPILETASDVVDIGCGRGELLRALREKGVRARGVDANAGMVELCRADGLDVAHGDAVSFLDRQSDGSIGGLVAIQVVEHFEPAYLATFLETAFHKMRAGAPLILETINPACWMAFFETYIRDLTHQRPLHPDTLRFLVESAGFTSVDVQFRQPVGEGDRLPHVKILGDTGTVLPRNLAQLADAVNAHADRLNARLFSYADYAVIARR
ncbi:MAG TPA: class I SAM-dependent methyltransferase [Vicinamibacterales bacterium]|nr:class I SAM-dependent methyltransferase [Vicinamibacterales bacterium]